MRILLDVDGVVADFVPHLIRRIKPVLKSTGKPLRKCDVTQWAFFDLAEDRKAIEAELAKPDFWATLPLVRSARAGFRTLVDAGHEIVWCTAPWDGCEDWNEIRFAWVTEKLPGATRFVVTQYKSKCGGDAIIDDKVENVVAWRREHPKGHGVVFRQPWNRRYDGTRMNWKQITETFMKVQK